MKNDQFSELRSLAQLPEWDVLLRRDVWKLIHHTWTETPNVFEDIWRPYLASFPHHLKQSLHTFSDLDELQEAHERLPEAKWRFCWHKKYLKRDDIEALAQHPASRSLDGVEILTCSVTDQILEPLFDSPYLDNLTLCSLSDNPITSQSAQHIAQWGALKRVQNLYLSATKIDIKGYQYLAASKHLTKVNELRLASANIDDATLCVLVESPILQTVQELYLHENTIGPTSVAAFASSPHVNQVNYLVLMKNPIQSSGFRALMRSKSLINLSHLDVQYCHIDNQGAHALYEQPLPPTLRGLYLQYNQITDDGAEQIAQSPHLAQLERFELGANPIYLRGWEALAYSKAYNEKIASNFDYTRQFFEDFL